MKILKILFAAGCACALPAAAQADEPWFLIPKTTVSLGASTLGAGATLRLHNPHSWFGGRLSVNLFHFGINFSQAGARSNAQANLQNESVLLDLYPTRKNFHFTIGLVFNQNSANFSSTPEITGTLLSFLNESHYKGVIGNVHGPISFNPIAPYFGIGYDFNAGQHWTISADAGGMYQGNGRIALQPTGLLAVNPQVRAAVLANAYKADRMIDKMSFYPIISFQIGYKF